ncbi:MAG: transposase [bacterium]
MGRRTLEQLSKETKRSEKTLRTIFKKFLDNPPAIKIKPHKDCHLMIDGTYFKRNFCFANYIDNDLKYSQLADIILRENFTDAIRHLELLKNSGLDIASITSDGHKSLIKAVKAILPEVIHQRCIVHIQRMSFNYLTKHPKTQAGKDLRSLVKILHEINSFEKRDIWIKLFNKWILKYDSFLKERSYSISGRWWYAHKLLRRTRSLIKNALPNMFHYLNNPKIPKSTNGLETRFSFLKNDVKIHRGMTREHRKSFILYYIFYKNNP